MKVVTISVSDIPSYMEGETVMFVDVYELGEHLLRKSFPCLELAERWILGRWPKISEHGRTDPPTPIEGRYYDDPEVMWVGKVE
jgi:hypothetical protein